jgi:xanthine/uracil/vitamin C permease (AzgA family)
VTARLAGWLVGVAAAVLLFPISAVSVIDGDQEEWVKTGVGWAYHVPWNKTPAIPLGLSIVGGLVAGFATWAVVTLFRHPEDTQRTRAVASLALCLAVVAVIAVIFAIQPSSHYKHVF